MKYELKGLDCPNCANKIECELKKLEGLSDLTVNFATRTIDIDPALEQDVAKVLQKVEPHVKLIPQKLVSEKRKETDEDDKAMLKWKLINIILSAISLCLGVVLSTKLHGPYEVLEYGIFFVAYFLAGREVLQKSIGNIVRGQVFDENFLMTVATIGAFAIHELPEAVGVMLFYSVGEYFQDLAVSRSRRSIVELMDIRPDYANLIIDNKVEKVAPEAVKIGETIIVMPGEKVPLDGEVIEGDSNVDTSALTGESVPRRVQPGEKVMAGMVNGQGLLKVRVEKTFGESSVSKILDLVQSASGRKARTEQFITKFARYYTPAVVFGALAIAIIPPLAVPGESFAKWFYRALTMLVISCPCALVVSIPLGYFGGIGGASRNGILVKGASFLEALTNVDTVVFDKTGTLTKGVFKVADIKAQNGYSEQEVLQLAAYAEVYSNHPIAKSILEAYDNVVDKDIIKDYKEIPGHGIIVNVNGKKILAGNQKLLKQEGIALAHEDFTGTVVHVAVDGSYAGYITIADEIRPDGASAIKELKNLGIKRTVMLTGDAEDTASNIAKKLGIDEYHAGLLPEEKVLRLEQLQGKGDARRKVVFVGDGINDAPVITRADVGIAMGGLGSDAAIEAADVVIMEDMPSKVAEAIKIARHTKKIVIQNIIFALGVKGIFLALGAVGVASMWEAVFADVGVALLTVLNSTRTLLHNIK
ncbi:cadmium-translocating P-type ATPase [Tepidanaerobacter sp. GT38]|uniref:heavy metal translocating P-type ATPase n=1 Tax=Tepidanaerobacter sp. GT38 TaxID=2722793 RepID=UPI001F02B364|nr:heavy metal translocating P-type ATPase [Tepidanaerobacter sp. GT38]MCG1012343.1 cadmium-translocating P-type ATPase [Tepidanaerobacter sp. GT38]